jgi:hypothetical protein
MTTNCDNTTSGGQHHQHHLFNYHDAVIYPSDLGIIDSPSAWLNDALIHFQMTRLQYRRRRTGVTDEEKPKKKMKMGKSSVERRMDESDSDEIIISETENLFLDP